MTLSPYESWLNTPYEWSENGLSLTLCTEILEIEVAITNLIENSNYTLIEANLEGCYSDLLIYNKLNADQIIFNLQGNQLRLAKNLQIIGKAASLTIVNNNDAFLTNLTTTNVKELFYIAGIYQGLDIASKVLYDKINAAVFINNLNSDSLTITCSKLALSGIINLSNKLTLTIEGDNNKNYNLDTQHLKYLSAKIFLKISDLSKSGAGIYLQGNIFSLNSFIDGNNLISNDSTIIANRLSSFFKGNSTIDGIVHAADMIISSTNLQIKNGSELKIISFKGYENKYPQPIILRTKDNFVCEENAHIIADGRIIIQAGKSLLYNGTAKAKDDIQLKGEAYYKEVGSTANIISHFGNIIINNGTKTSGNLIINGIVLAEQGIINYIIGESFSSNGINAGAMGIFLNSTKSYLSKVEINRIDESVVVRWKSAMAADKSIVASLISLANDIQLIANEVLLNEGASILNLADISLSNDRTGIVLIKADSYIGHLESNITANGAVIEEVTEKNVQEYGITFLGNTQVESRFAEVSITSISNIKLDGKITGGTGVYIEAACLENSVNSGIHALLKDLNIHLSECLFNNLGVLSSNSSTSITTDGDNFENHNLISGNSINIFVHGRKYFINSGIVSSNNKVKIGLEIDGKILLKPDSIIYAGSYDFGHFDSTRRLRIGEVECHGCSIYTIKTDTSIISASILSVRITHYEKTEYQQVDQKTFTTNTWKDSKKFLGITADVKHRASHATLTLLENYHNYYGPAINQHTGDVIYDVGVMSVVMSSVTGDGTAHFPNPTMLQIRSEQSEKIIITDQNSFTHMNTISNVQNAFSLTSADVNNKYGMVTIAQPKDSINSILSFRNGMEGNFMQVSPLGRGRSIISDKGNSILPTVEITGTSSAIIADITIDSGSKDKTIVVYNWHSKVNQLETITIEDLQEKGFDVSKLIHPSILNSKIWGYASRDLSHSIDTSTQENTLNIKPIFFLKNDPLLTSFIDNPLNIVHFLASLAFNDKGLVYTIGDGHFIAKLVDQAIFILLGKLTGVSNTKILNTLALNAKYEQQLQNLTVGSPLTLQQTKNLTASILWPVWLEHCINEIKCLDFRLYFNAKALENSLSGAVIASEGEINFKVLGDVLVGLTGQIKSDQAIKFDLQGNFVNLGLISSNNATTINAKNIGNAGKFNIGQGNLTLNAIYDIVNIGTSLVNKGNVHVKAGHDIRELILINPANPVPCLTKRAIYAIGGNLYYEATNDITQQASVIFASGDIEMLAGHDITIESTHHSRTIKEEHSRKHYLIQSTIDQYDAVIMVEGSVIMNAGNNFVGSGIKLSSSNSDVNVTVGNRAILEDRTSYAWNYQGATKTKFLGKSSVSVSWTTSQTANLEITAPGGRVYVSSKECILEGGVFDGQKPMFKCDKLLIKPHEVVNKVITTTTQSGMFTPNVPIIDLVQSSQPEKHILGSTIAGPINSLINMQGPLDLLPAVNLISSIPGLKADYQLLKGNQAGFSPAALVGALLSKYISASISFGTKKTTTSVTQTISTLTQISGNECEFKGIDGEIAANVNCQNSVSIEFDNLKLAGAKNTLQVISETESSSFDVRVSLSGVSFGVSFGNGNFQQDQAVHNSGTIHSKNVSIKINNRLEIENAQINGKNVTVEALSIEIKLVIDSARSTSESYGGSIGVTVGWTGTVMPTISAEYANAVQQSQVVHLLSGITGESVEVTAQKLTYNIETISAENDLNIKAESLEYIGLPQVENIDTELRLAASISPRSDGKANYFASIYSRDGDEVMSIGYSSAFMEGINIAKEFIAENFQKQQDVIKTPQLQKINNKNEQTADKQEENKRTTDKPDDKAEPIKLDAETSKEVSASQEKTNDVSRNKRKNDLPDHLKKLYNEAEEIAEAMGISEADKSQIKTRMYNNLKEISSGKDADFKHLCDVFSFRDSPNIWYLENLAPKGDEATKNVRFEKEWKEAKQSYREEIEREEKREAAKSPAIKVQEAAVLEAEKQAYIKEQMYLLKQYIKEEDRKKAYITSAIIDYMVAKSKGTLTVEAIEALGVLGILELPHAAGLLTLYGIATFGDDEMEFIDKIKAKGNYKK